MLMVEPHQGLMQLCVNIIKKINEQSLVNPKPKQLNLHDSLHNACNILDKESSKFKP
jgi:hypothetical protein